MNSEKRLESWGKALMPILTRVRRDVSGCKRNGVSYWTKDPIDKRTMLRHFAGDASRGAAPIEPGQSDTRIAVLDLDSHQGETTWEQMTEVASMLMRMLADDECHAIPFSSHGGRGVHLYLIWEQPQPSSCVRRFLANILVMAGMSEGTKGVACGEVEIFPKQDFIPTGGHGNFFVLPLAGKSEPLEYLLGLKKMGRDYVVQLPFEVSRPVPRGDALATEIEQHCAEAPRQITDSDLRDLADALEDLAKNSYGETYGEWTRIGQCLKAGANAGRAAEFYQLFLTYSMNLPKFQSESDVEKKWAELGGDRAGLAGIFSAARTLGWVPAEETPSADGFSFEDRVSRYKLLRPSDVRQLPAVKYLIKGLLPAEGFAAIYGAPGSGKSFLAADMAAAIAGGNPWFQHKVVSAPVVYMVLEGEGGVKLRMRAWESHHKTLLPENYFVVRDPFKLTAQVDIEDLALVVPAGAVLIVDTLNRAGPGADENSSVDMGKLIEALKELQRRIHGLVIVVHHAGKDAGRGLRGHSSLSAALDVSIEVSRDGDVRKAVVTKNKDGRDGQVLHFSLATVDLGRDEDDEPLASCVVVQGERPAETRKLSDSQANALRTLVGLSHEKGIDVAVDRFTWKTAFCGAAGGGASDSKRKAFDRALKELVDRDLVHNIIGQGYLPAHHTRQVDDVAKCPDTSAASEAVFPGT